MHVHPQHALAVPVLFAALAVAQTPLRPGSSAPAFSLPYATKDTIAPTGISLDTAVRSGPVVLAFYPADWSGGCTKEMCAFRDNFAGLATLNATVLGISGDYVHSHRAWAQFHGLPFALLSDHDHAVARAYGSFNERSGYNRRTVFVIDTARTIAYMDTSYNVASGESFARLVRAVEELARETR
jgi:peroxiredoxin